MKTKVNYHVHSTISDGKISPEEVVKEFLENGVKFMCFTDHLPSPENIDPYGKNFYQDKGFKELKRLQKKYKKQIDISIGAEFDWISGIDYWYKKELEKRDYDFTIGSMHSFFNKKKELCGFWDGSEKITRFVKSLGGTKEYVTEYFKQIRLLVKSGFFDCVGHIDILKFKNKENKLFFEDKNYYKQEIDETLKLIKESGMCIEINTRGFLKEGKDRQYPSLWILKKANKLGIPITIGTDFHNTGQVEPYLSYAYELAKKAGYKSVLIFKKRKPTEIKLE